MYKNKVCRTCLSTERLNPIFLNLDNNERYSTALELTTGLKITIDDGLPQLICTKCVNFINKSLEFRLQCKNNALELLKYTEENSEIKINENNETTEDNSNKQCNLIYNNTSDDANSAMIFNQEINIKDHAGLNEIVKDDISEEHYNTNSNEPFSNMFVLETKSLNDKNYKLVEIDIKNEDSIENKSYFMTEISQNIPKTTLNTTKKSNEIKTDFKVIHSRIEKTANISKSELIRNENRIPILNIELQPTTNEVINSYFDITENNRNKVTCKLCSEVISKKNKIGHLGNWHKDIEIGYEKCDVCKIFTKKDTLKRDTMNSHRCRKKDIVICKDKTKTKCDICNKNMLKNSLKQHIKVQHSGMAPICEHCGRTFGNKYRLQEHYRAKHGYEKYKCGYCSFESASVLSLKNHERLHTLDKPYICETCGVKFHAAYLLRQHNYLHTTDYNFKCDQCPAKFKSGNNLRSHVSSCHSSEKINCSVCGKKFSSKIYAQRHMKRTHKSDLKII